MAAIARRSGDGLMAGCSSTNGTDIASTRQHGFRSGERAQAQGVAEVGQRHHASDGHQVAPKIACTVMAMTLRVARTPPLNASPEATVPVNSLAHGKCWITM